MDLKDIKISVIHPEEIHPGDYIIIHCNREDADNVTRWAGHYFEPLKCRVGIVFNEVSIAVRRDGTQVPPPDGELN